MLRNMTVMGRLGLGFSLVIALLVLSMGMSIRQLRLLGSDVEDFAQDRVPKLALSGKVVETLLQSARQMRNVLILDAESEIASEIADVARNAELVHEALAEIGKHVTDDTERNLLKEIEDARAKYLPLERRFLDIAKKGDYSTAKDEMLGELRRAQDRYVQAVNAFIEYQAANSASEAREAQSGQDNAQLVLLSLTALAVLVAALAAALITRAILRSLGGEPAYAAQVARSIAEGDLTVTVATKAGDSASLLGSIARMRDALCASVGEIRAAAELVGAATEQIARGNADLSTRTEQQAAALGETAASMEELTGTVKQNDENARQARMLADGACAVAAQGGNAMKEVIDAMQGISESSRRIAEIIGVIDGIAFQTNILALNAAVEAARAGEQGRGFAVVASEVRSLAHRSAQAARQVKALIGESAGRVDGGVRQVENTSRTMQQIIDSAGRVSGLIAEISEASGAQLAGIEQVGRAVTQMDANTQQNAAVVEQAAAAARHMASQAEALLAAVARFKVEVARAAASPAEDRSVARTETPAIVEARAPAAQEHPLGTQRLAFAAADDWREF